MPKIDKSGAAWRAERGANEYRITRQKGTEPAFSGRHGDCHENGTYHCRCCGAQRPALLHQFGINLVQES